MGSNVKLNRPETLRADLSTSMVTFEVASSRYPGMKRDANSGTRVGVLRMSTLQTATAIGPNSKHWFTTSFPGGRCRKAMLGVCNRSCGITTRAASLVQSSSRDLLALSQRNLLTVNPLRGKWQRGYTRRCNQEGSVRRGPLK